ncbi:WW domain binding protein 11-domain-containing protein [Flagelloscypha sp. PMI_526]|nr:WW domain binding protein 11-domain-containing protein [Flagelloscypha sp. PMI_526]
MAKGKSANPADAYRKQQRKKELKKNKEGRAKTREFALVKKDTTDLEAEIQELENKSDASPADKTRLTALKSDLEKINKKKEDYVKEHPEQRKLVYHRKNGPQDQTPASTRHSRNVYNKDGSLRHPERSIYYDPVFNPLGVPPPGMPYAQRPLRPDEIDSEAEDESESSDDDDIPLPDGAPPGEEDPSLPPLPPGPPPLPPGPLPPFMAYPIPSGSHLPPPSASASRPSPRISMQPNPCLPQCLHHLASRQLILPHGNAPIQTAPPILRPPQSQPVVSARPKLSDAEAAAAKEAATVFAEPELRDFKKEATSFVPAALKRKRPSTTPKINAAPSTEASEIASTQPARPDLMETLKSNLSPSAFTSLPPSKKPKVDN